MKVKLLVFAAALLMLTSFSFAQPFAAALFNDTFVLTDSCDGGTPLPDGTPIQIFLDANGNGPDAADQLAPVCDNPPNCETGPMGTVNFNTFPMNGEEVGMGAGLFYGDTYLTSALGMPTVARYYLKITLASGLVWTSQVATFVVGPQEFDFTAWTCTPPPPPTCLPVPENRAVNFTVTPPSGPQSGDACITLCREFPTVTVCVGPLGSDEAFAARHIPRVNALSDCQCADAPAAGYDWVAGFDGWTLTNVGGVYFYCKQITLPANGTEGCVHLNFDWILAVQMGNIAITPADNSVNVKFNTLAETNVAKFEVRRDHQVVGSIEAANSPSGHEYSFVDNSVNNGTTYTYELVVVNADNSREVVATQAVTPSLYKAVVTEYALHQNFPNPFNPSTSIRFDLVEKNFVTLKVYNANGQEVATIATGERAAGVNVVNFDATNLTSGLYFYTLKVGNVYSATKKMLLVK